MLRTKDDVKLARISKAKIQPKPIDELSEKKIEEAEAFLNDFKWTSEAPSRLLKNLTSQSSSLNREIIELLLQWEDTAEIESSSKKKPSQGSGSMNDTFAVLHALDRVELELDGVDQWIAEQLIRLEDTKTKLILIESQSSTLEASYQNVSEIRKIVDELVKRLSLTPNEEKILRDPESFLSEKILELSSLKNTQKALRPLFHATKKLRDALSVDWSSLDSEGVGGSSPSAITPTMWNELQSLTAISSQRLKLSATSDLFCKNFGSIMPSFFEDLLKHDSINESGRGRSILVRDFAFLTDLIQESVRLFIRPSSGLSSIPQTEQGSGSGRPVAVYAITSTGLFPDKSWPPMRDDYTVGGRKSLCLMSLQVDEANYFKRAQTVLHETLSPFIPLLHSLFELDPSQLKVFQSLYSSGPMERLYSGMLKDMCKELRVRLGPKLVAVNMSNIAPYKMYGRQGPHAAILKFFPKGVTASSGSKQAGSKALRGAVLPSWILLAASLVAILPVIRAEEIFLLQLLRVSPSDEKVRRALDKVFENVRSDKLLAYLSASAPSPLEGMSLTGMAGGVHAATGEEDGIEALAQLVVLQQFMVDHLGVGVEGFSPVGSMRSEAATPTPSIEEPSSAYAGEQGESPRFTESGYIAVYLEGIRQFLLSRVRRFSDEQAAWVMASKSDPKKPAASLPVLKFVSMLYQLVEIVGSHRLACADEFLDKVAGALFAWIVTLSMQNEKYTDIVLIHNYGSLSSAMSKLVTATQGDATQAFVALDTYTRQSAERVRMAEISYVAWMIAYEFPALAGLAEKLDGVSGRVRQEELSLYVKRKDVMTVAQELTLKHLTESVSAMRKRLEKHFLSSDDEGASLPLIARLWDHMRDQTIAIVKRVDAAATNSYQVSLDIGPNEVHTAFSSR